MRKPLLAILSGEYDPTSNEATIAEFCAECILALRPTITRGGLFYYLFPNGKV